MVTILDVNFGRELFESPETLEKWGQNIRGKNSLEDFAEPANLLKFTRQN